MKIAVPIIARFLLDPRSMACKLDKTTPVKQIKSVIYKNKHFYNESTQYMLVGSWFNVGNILLYEKH